MNVGKIFDNMATALSAIMYYIAAAVSVVVKNRYLMYISIIAVITMIMKPTSFKLGRVLQYSSSRRG